MSETKLQVGVSKEVITPERGVPLVGYFNPRPNTGILDDLYVRVILFQKGAVISGLIVCDLCFLSTELIKKMKSKITALGLTFADNCMFCATHTHTGPYIAEFFGNKPDQAYLDSLVKKTAVAVHRAYKNLSDAELSHNSVHHNPLAFNRRYWMKDGSVLTNPGQLNPDIVKPEGPVDDEIGVLTVKQDGMISAVVVTIVNHTDTVSGNFVSADWPGRMERTVQETLGYDVPVFTLIGCAGNINHIDVSNDNPYYGYAEANRIGRGYAEIVKSALGEMQPLPVQKIRVKRSTVTLAYQTVDAGALKNAHDILNRPAEAGSDGNLTSEGLAKGEGAVARFFAEQLIEFKTKCSGKNRVFDLIRIGFDDVLAYTSLPGEMFTEIGLEIKKKSPFARTWPVCLAMGECGYVCLAESYTRGGYEILPVVGGGPHPDTAEQLIRESLKILKI